VIKRHAEKTIREFSRGYPVVAITGPRQSGKTTLARAAFKDRPYVSLENPDNLDFAENDPRGFLAHYGDGAVIDEAQRCPRLFSYLQQVVDEGPKHCRFVLTGSQQFGLHSRISQSLAGRTALIHLLPFTFDEWYGRRRKRPGIEEVLHAGLYPPIHDRKLAPGPWHANYVQTYVERDIRQLINVRDLRPFRTFIRMCASRSGQLLNLSSLASDCGVTHNTAKAWISILQASYIVMLLSPHFSNFGKRLTKTPKLYFYDTGLLCHLLAIRNPRELVTHASRGAVFETFVVSEICKAYLNRGADSPMYFWRDRGGREIDIVLETTRGLRPIEVKSARTIAQDSIDQLRQWLQLAGRKARAASLVYAGEDPLSRSGIAVVPWFRSGALAE
jgi:predicted AAA+ superfamily ATPase